MEKHVTEFGKGFNLYLEKKTEFLKNITED
jgi:hypothetical protein